MKQQKHREIEQHANLTGDWSSCVRMAWDLKSPTMDWLGLEATLNAYIRATNNHDLDEIVASFTKRGHTLPCPKCGQHVHVDDSCNITPNRPVTL